jgi:hypothetical protein
MPTSLSVGEVVQVRIWAADAEQASVNTIWYQVAATGASAATDQDVADERSATLAPLMKALLGNVAIFRGAQVMIHANMPPHLQLTAPVFQNGQQGAGTAGAIMLPRQTSGLISFQTASPGVKNRGRFYVPFPSDNNNTTPGAPSALYITNLTNLAAQINSGLALVTAGRTATLVRIIRHFPDKNGITFPPTPVTGGGGNIRWATQRRRGSFGRFNGSPI